LKTIESVNLFVHQRHTALKRSLKKFQGGSKDTRGRNRLDQQTGGADSEQWAPAGQVRPNKTHNIKDSLLSELDGELLNHH
jgi:hypothetical protein